MIFTQANGTVIAASVAVIHLAAAAILAQDAIDHRDPQAAAVAGVFNDVPLIALCVIGSTLGAMLTLSLFPVPQGSTDAGRSRQMMFRFASSLACGVCFTPMTVRFSGLDFSGDAVIFVAGIVAAFGVAVLHLLVPRLEKLVDWFISRWTK